MKSAQILVLGISIIAAVIIPLVGYKKRMKQNPKFNHFETDSLECDRDSTAEPPIPFGYKCAWIAVKASSSECVARALGLKDVVPVNWSTGIKIGYGLNGGVFVTPQMDQWVLVIGNSLPDIGDLERQDHITPLLKRLSDEFGEAHYYATHRVTEYHAWIKMVQGEVVRAYAYLGEQGVTLRNEGMITAEEKEIDCFEEMSEVPDDALDPQNGLEPVWVNEEHVLSIACKWSVDTLFNKEYEPGLGLAGMLTL